ncbi:MAG: leucine-rich repeat domain-containing protein [Limisphaerales bacterium]
MTIPTKISGLAVTTSMTIPKGVRSIGQGGFENCTNLTSVTIPSSVTNIPSDGFENCTSLTNVTIPESVTSIGTYAFNRCSNLSGVFFAGNAPDATSTVFQTAAVTVYSYRAPPVGWILHHAGVPVVLWDPVIQASGTSFGVKDNQFAQHPDDAPNASKVIHSPCKFSRRVQGSYLFLRQDAVCLHFDPFAQIASRMHRMQPRLDFPRRNRSLMRSLDDFCDAYDAVRTMRTEIPHHCHRRHCPCHLPKMFSQMGLAGSGRLRRHT